MALQDDGDIIHLIQQIHASDAYGSVVEAGCVALSKALLDEPGASGTVFDCCVPYNKFAAEIAYGTNVGERSVSRETVSCILTQKAGEHERIMLDQKMQDKYHGLKQLNLVVATSFQFGGKNEPTKTTHGWIGIRYKTTERYYHVSLRGCADVPRSELLVAVASSCVGLLHAMIHNSDDTHVAPGRVHATAHVDIVCNADGKTLGEELIQLLLHQSSDTLLTLVPGSSSSIDAVRFEDVTRQLSASSGSQKLVVFKGSFNPPTREHQRLMRETCKRHGTSGGVFMISLCTVDKNSIANLWDRVRWLHLCGAPAVLVNRNGRFADAITILRSTLSEQCWKHQPLVFPMGADTWDRLESGLVDHAATQYAELVAFPRTDVSSTRVRELMMHTPSAETIQAITALVPAEILPTLCVPCSNEKNPL